MDDCNRGAAERPGPGVASSDSSMDDCNEMVPASGQASVAGSDSSMDDCNTAKGFLSSAAEYVQIPLWTIVTLGLRLFP